MNFSNLDFCSLSPFWKILVNSNFEFFKFGTLEKSADFFKNNLNKIWIYHFNSLNLYSER